MKRGAIAGMRPEKGFLLLLMHNVRQLTA